MTDVIQYHVSTQTGERSTGFESKSKTEDVDICASKSQLASYSSSIVEAPYPPTGNTGGNFRHPNEIKEKPDKMRPADPAPLPQTTPPKQARKSRSKSTSNEMRQFLNLWFFDYLTVTIPNGINGKGTKIAGALGEKEGIQAQKNLCLWAVLQGLHRQRIGKGSDQYSAAANYGLDPLSKVRLVSVRAGHAKNMPGLEIPGGDGACAELAVSALTNLGPVLMPRVDVTADISQPLLFEDLLEYATSKSARTKMAAPRLFSSDSGETFYWGHGEASVKVYQKDKERFGKGKITEADVDENLTRIEFTFRPQKFGKKAGLANIARKSGPGALLGTTHWVRNMVQHIAAITTGAQDCRMCVTRVEKTPNPKSAHDRAMHGGIQYAKTFCEAVAASIVENEFEGDWMSAEIDPVRLELEAAELFHSVLRGTNSAASVVVERGLDALRTSEAEAERTHNDLLDWMIRQREETEAAQAALTLAGDTAAQRPRRLDINFTNEGEMKIIAHNDVWF